MSIGWQPARCSTVIGAAHRRRGQPCQDASLTIALCDPKGEAVQLMAVADGHGNRRHWLSQVGSALACQQAEQAVRAALAHTPIAEHEAWQQLLVERLPSELVAGWLAATQADWAQRPEAQQQPYTPLPYGCTLGLVLLTPRWWAHTGLGDWDLVCVDGDSVAQLVSDESELEVGGGEATASLCLTEAEALFRPRTGLHPLTSADLKLALVLSTDGVRKSCASDDDFLRLCSQLGEIHSASVLEEGLEQITQQGSGDDVSVALCIWGEAQQPHRPGPPPRWRRHPRWLLPGLLGATLLGVSGWWWWQRPSPLAQEITRLCAAPWAIQATLNQRRAQFQQLAGPDDVARAKQLRSGAQHDPLGALIAASRQQQALGCPALQRALAMQWQQTAAAATSAGRMPSGPSRRPAQGP